MIQEALNGSSRSNVYASPLSSFASTPSSEDQRDIARFKALSARVDEGNRKLTQMITQMEEMLRNRRSKSSRSHQLVNQMAALSLSHPDKGGLATPALSDRSLTSRSSTASGSPPNPARTPVRKMSVVFTPLSDSTDCLGEASSEVQPVRKRHTRATTIVIDKSQLNEPVFRQQSDDEYVEEEPATVEEAPAKAGSHRRAISVKIERLPSLHALNVDSPKTPRLSEEETRAPEGITIKAENIGNRTSSTLSQLSVHEVDTQTGEETAS